MGYGQFCPLALASEVVGERWTPLVLRELLLGARRFNDIQRGVPRMSPSLLTRRLRTLENAGIIERSRSGGHVEYVLTPAGEELLPTIQSLAEWGKRWLPATLSADDADPDLIMWDMHRRMALENMPESRTVVEFNFSDQPRARQRRWLVGDRSGVTLCITDPGFEVDLFVMTDSRTMTWVWYGDVSLKRAIADGTIRLHGPARLCSAFPTWLKLSHVADIPRNNARAGLAG
ncbi:helix-turn-helix domain-containing protein [Aquisalimonas lutea]|uniref:winged helix-turn-helix transcriptional regulator n=1 Tax=Aquisalimonas lutea TaxID=1327750 RepID=UPI0025B5938A|nr:helix-turn-helix domain-containing protein [Aquisalimonas lutea]MDN3516265.1 helix-turn-helix domain-containing protein [Aquisalimonas lutea]